MLPALRDRVRELRRVPASQLNANQKNWRIHPKAQRKALSGLLDEIGFADAVLARELPDGSLELIDGHLRTEISKDQEIPVLVLDVNAEEADLLLATLDPLAGMAAPDLPKQIALLSGLTPRLAPIGNLLAGWLSHAAELPEEDEVQQPPRIAVTKPGDLWLLGQHRLLCGDSTDADSVARLLDRVTTPLLMTADPPYGVTYDPAWRQKAAEAGRIKFGAKRTAAVTGDQQVDWSAAWKLFPGDIAYVWHAGVLGSEVRAHLVESGFQVRNQIVWIKPSFAISRGHYNWQHEPCWYAVRVGRSAKWSGDHSQSTVWKAAPPGMSDAPREGTETDHGAQKPVALYAIPIRNHGKKGDGVYDPFVGSGTSIVAAEQVERSCFGLEIEPRFCDVVVERWQNLTGQKSKRAGSLSG